MSVVTQWFVDENPHRVGWYERDYSRIFSFEMIAMCFFDGYHFSVQKRTDILSAEQNLPWRGLAEKPE